MTPLPLWLIVGALGVLGALAVSLLAIAAQLRAEARRALPDPDLEGAPHPRLPTPDEAQTRRDAIVAELGFTTTSPLSPLTREDEDGTRWEIQAPRVLRAWSLTATREVDDGGLTLALSKPTTRPVGGVQTSVFETSAYESSVSCWTTPIALAAWMSAGGAEAIRALSASFSGYDQLRMSTGEVTITELMDPQQIKETMGQLRAWFASVEANAARPVAERVGEALAAHPHLLVGTIEALQRDRAHEALLADVVAHLLAHGTPRTRCLLALTAREALSGASRIKALIWGLSQDEAPSRMCADALLADHLAHPEAIAAMMAFIGVSPPGKRLEVSGLNPNRAFWLPQLVAAAPEHDASQQARKTLLLRAMDTSPTARDTEHLCDTLGRLLQQPGEHGRLLDLAEGDRGAVPDAARLAALLWVDDDPRVDALWSGAPNGTDRIRIAWALKKTLAPALLRRTALLLDVARHVEEARVGVLEALLGQGDAREEVVRLTLESYIKAPHTPKLERLLLNHDLLDHPEALPAARVFLKRSDNTRAQERVLYRLASQPDVDAETLALVLTHPKLTVAALRNALSRRGDESGLRALSEACACAPRMALANLAESFEHLRLAQDAAARKVHAALLVAAEAHPERAALVADALALPWIAEIEGVDWLVEVTMTDPDLERSRRRAAYWTLSQGGIRSLRALVQAEHWRDPHRDQAIEALRERLSVVAGGLSLAEGDQAGGLSLSTLGTSGDLTLDDGR